MASAFKSTDLVDIHCVCKENFVVTVSCEGFYVSLVCREVHISYVESICERRRSLIPAVVANSRADELFARVRSPKPSSSCDIPVTSQDSSINVLKNHFFFVVLFCFFF